MIGDIRYFDDGTISVLVEENGVKKTWQSFSRDNWKIIKKTIIREFLLGFDTGRDLLIEWHKALHENCNCEACKKLEGEEE